MAYIAEAISTAVMRNPACASPDTKVIEAMTVMSEVNATSTSCVVVIDHQEVLGVITERDMIKFACQRLPVEHLTLRQVLTHPPVTIRESALTDLISVLNLFEKHQVSHLPIVDDSDQFVGIISNSSLLQISNSISIQQAKAQEQLQVESVRQQSEARLRTSEQRYISVLAASPVGIVHTDLEGICTYANERYSEIIGIESAKLIGQLWFQGHNAENIERINQEFECSLRENRPFQIEYSILRPDGAKVWIYGQAVVEYDAEGQMIGYIGTATDISDRKISESLLASQHKILEHVAKAEPLSEIFDALLKTMESYLTGSVCSITLCRDGQLCDVTAPSLPQEYISAVVGLPIAEGVGSCGTAAFRRGLVIVSDIDNDPLWREGKSSVLCYGLQSCTSIPIFASDQTLLGVFGIYYRQKKAPQSQELEWIAQAANIAGIAIEREQAVQELKRLNQDLENRVQERTIELQTSERRYASLAKAAPVAIFRFDAPLNCVYVNEHWSKMSGRSVESALGYGWMEALHPDDREQIVTDLSSYFTQQVSESHIVHVKEGRYIRPDGTTTWYYVNLAKEFNDDGNVIGYVGSLTDITEQKTAELALLESETKFQRITESVPGMIYRYVLHPDGSDECTYVSPQVRHFFELDPDIVLQNVNHLWERVHPDDISATLEKVKVSAESLKPFFIEERLILPQAGLKWVQIIARPERQKNGDIIWDGVVLDITDRKKLEQEQTKLTEILEATPDYIGMVNAQGEILWHNKQLRKLRPELSGSNEHRIVSDCHPDWANKIIFDKALPIAIQEGSWSGELALLDGTGGEIPVSQVIIAHKSANGTVENFSTIMRDVSDRKQAEAHLQRTNQELIRATRLKDEFLANMSHELRTPLNAILGISEALQEMIFGSLNAEQIRFLKIIEESGNHLLRLINDILDVSKIESGQMNLDLQPTDICTLCNNSLAFIKQQALRKRIQIKTNIPPQLPKLLIDERRILQVLINLLNNAVKFTPEDGFVNIEASYHEQDEDSETSNFKYNNRIIKELTSVSMPAKNYIKIDISDTGIGIAAEDMSRLFQPFIQIDSALNRQYTGTGLGLALVKQIIELHGGVVNLRSEVGVGSCFSLELPYEAITSIPESTITVEHVNQQQLSTPTKTKVSHLILLAEDSPANISVIVGYLEIYGYRFIIANNGLEAISLAKSEHPDLILMDIQMPEMDGIEAINQIRQDSQFQNTPIIALTALAMKGDEERCLSAGANSYLSKPVKLRQLSELIQQLIVDK